MAKKKMTPSEALVETLVAEGVEDGDRFVGTNLPDNPDFAKVAEAMGAVGFTVEDYWDVQDVVREAMACGKPCVINAVVEGGEKVLAEPFRRDALEMPTRYLDKYAHLSLE